jgi:creatinine amidohydrolase
VILSVSPIEQHGPHLPLGVDGFTARHLAESIAARIVASRTGWSAVLVPTLHLGSFTLDAVGTIRVRQRVVRDAVIDYGSALARARFRYILVANGHGGPGHLVALDEAAAAVGRRFGVTMASVTGHLAWELLSGRLLPKLEAALGRALSAEERLAFSEDSHGGWWETSIMLLLRPDLVDDAFHTLEPTRYSLARRLVPNYAVRNGAPGYVGHPARADARFAEAGAEVLLAEVMRLVDGLLDGRIRPADRRSPFYRLPPLRTNFLPGLAAVACASLAGLWLRRRHGPAPTRRRDMR